MSVHQISVFLENKAGQLAEITGILADREVDLRAISIAEISDYGVLRMIVDDAARASEILHESGYILSNTEVQVIEVPDQAGGLAPVLAALAEGHLDVEYMYSLFTHRNDKAYMVFRVAEPAKLEELLLTRGVRLATAEELDLK